MSESGKGILIGLGIGALVGVAAGMLLAPQSGKENREFIANKYSDVIKRIREKRRGGKSPDQAESEVEAEMSGMG